MTPAKVAGLLYLPMGIPAVIGLQYVPRTLIVPGDPAATAEHIRTSEWLFRLGIASELISAIGFLFLGLALYRVFKGVDRDHASLMVILVLVSIPITLVTVTGELGALALLNGTDLFSALGRPQLDELAFVLLRLHSQGLVVAEVFWGLWLFPLALLALRSGFVPRIVGVLLVCAGTAWLAVSSTAVFLPQYLSSVSTIATLPEAGEFAMFLWLLTTRTPPTSRAHAQVAAAS